MAASIGAPSQYHGDSDGGAGKTTESLLREIGTGTAAEAVMAVRYITSPPGPTFIPSLDELMLEGRPHRGGSSLQRGDLIEVVGPSGSGKTSLLIFLLLTTLLSSTVPSDSSTIRLGGRAAHAVLIQPKSQRTLVPRLAQSMRAHIAVCGPTLLSDQVEEIIAQSLSRLKVYTVRRWREIALALRAAGGLDADGEEEGGVDLVVIDGLGDGWYPHRWADEQRGKRSSNTSGAAGIAGKVVNTEDVGMREIMDGIGRLRKELGSVVVVSVQALRASQNTPFPTPHLPYPYPTPYNPRPNDDPNTSNLSGSGYSPSPTFWPLTAQISLTGRTKGLQYPGETTLVDALRERSKARRSDRDGSGGGVRYEGIVRMPIAQNVVGTRAGARFRFKIGQEGVEVYGDDQEPA